MMELEFDRAHKGYIFCSLVAQRFCTESLFLQMVSLYRLEFMFTNGAF